MCTKLAMCGKRPQITSPNPSPVEIHGEYVIFSVVVGSKNKRYLAISLPDKAKDLFQSKMRKTNMKQAGALAPWATTATRPLSVYPGV